MEGIEIRARREALGLSQQVFSEFLDVKQVTLSTWEGGRRFPRDPLSVHMVLRSLEEAASDLLEELLEAGEFEEEMFDDGEAKLIAYESQEEYEKNEPVWSRRLPLPTHRLVVGRACAILLDEGMNAHITSL